MMDKQAAVIIGVIGVVLALILYWIFGGTENEAEKQPPQTPPVTNTTPSNEEQEAKGNASTDQLSKDQNESVKNFARDFTKKYLNYNPSKPTAHIESLKSLMADDVYAQQIALFKAGNPNIKSIQIKKIYITDIETGEWYNTLTVPVDVTISTAQGQKVDFTYIYVYNISQDSKTGWKMVGIADESDVHD
jgi:hypothetical protein